jgi:hypothetical protein
MKEIVADTGLVAYCGLYCGACGRYLKGRCPGCHKNAKAGWCKVRTCCIAATIGSCADCAAYTDPKDCRKFNNFASKTIGLLLRSDRSACITQIKKQGLAGHAQDMAMNKRRTIRPR